ncbi:DUF4290 domain-containing protein [Chitinophaga sedimenti]|uniref:DUF4290 domain-containing protein n=1 Tax=Chitinophaga sedimenti TaxID=2033606 RepID=UPI00249E9BE8
MVMDKAIREENPEKKEGFTQTVANYMKLAYSNWHKESVHDDAIRTELHNISKGQLEYHPGGASKSSSDNFSASANEQQAAFRAQSASNSGNSGKRKRTIQSSSRTTTITRAEISRAINTTTTINTKIGTSE